MPHNPNVRVLIVVLDALRPEFVTPDLMPNLHGFATQGVRYTNSHSTFFTETRVNQSSVVTGCMPHRHGITANKFFSPEASPHHVLNTGDDIQLEAAFQRMNGELLDIPTLGQRLTSNGKRFATLSAGTPGGGRLINHSAEIDGSFRLAMHRPEAACPSDSIALIINKIGPIPDHVLPATKWISWAVDAYLEHIEPEISPDVMLLWLSEPDESFHKHGIGSDSSLTAIKHIDAEFGRILARHHDAITTGTMQVIAMSDHGQITLDGEPLDIVQHMRTAGFRASHQPADDVDYVVVPGNAAAIWTQNRTESQGPELTEKLVGWLGKQSWCGPLFTNTGLPGTVPLEEVRLSHRRAPDIALVFRHDDLPNAHGRKGRTLHDAPYPTGGGCHGGLSRYELHNVLTLGGQAFKAGTTIDIPAGNVDITPTVLALLGLEVPDGDFDGRVLNEAFCNGPTAADLSWTDHIITSNNTGSQINARSTHLSVTDFGHTRYINRGWVSDI